MPFVDLTHTFTSDTPVYPGDPKSTLEQVAFIEKDGYNDHKLTAVIHVGTHLDAPLHMIENGKSMDQISPENFFGSGVLLDVRDKETIDDSCLTNVHIAKGAIVLLYTGVAAKYGTNEYFETYPTITEDFAKKLVDLEIKILGMDMSGPDHDTTWPIHKILLGNEILILENLTNLDKLLSVKQFEVIALPVKLKSDAAPVRVIAKI